MKTAVGSPDDFHKKNPEEKFKRSLPGGDYKAGPKTIQNPHLERPYKPQPKKQTTRSMQFHTSVRKAKDPRSHSPRLNWEH